MTIILIRKEKSLTKVNLPNNPNLIIKYFENLEKQTKIVIESKVSATKFNIEFVVSLSCLESKLIL